MKFNVYGSLLALAAAGAFSASANAATIVVDGTIVSTLSQAVTLAQTAGDFPHTINVMTDTIVNDVQVSITQPMVINGNADGDNIKCDVLVDIPAIQAAQAVGLPGIVEKAYITVQTSGTVEIKDLNIHPNTDGVDATDVVGERVDGIRTLMPTTVEEAGNYIFTRVNVSGSDANNAYIPLDSGADLYATAAKKWSSGKGVTSAFNAHTAHAVVQLANSPGLGTYSATLDHCHIGLGKSAAVNNPAEGDGDRVILGGVYGHCGTDGIRVSGLNCQIKGTAQDRVRILRSTNINGGNAHCLEVDSNGRITLLEYVDIAGFNSAQQIKLNDSPTANDISRIVDMRYVRGLGKFNEGTNQSVFLNGKSELPDVQNCTFVGGTGTGPAASPLETQANYDGKFIMKDSILTSRNLGSININNTDAPGTVGPFTNCALPTDGHAAESLSTTTPFAGAGISNGTWIAPVSPVSVSPMYRLTLEHYDWSDAQGSGDPNNGPGNANVLRPTNPVYGSASSTGGPLNGGAGAPNAGIDAGVWMLM